MKQIVITKGDEETRKLGEELVRRWHLREGATLALYGELGSGKTTFVQGLAKGLGIKKRIISPTFIIVRRYTLYPKPLARKGASSAYTLYHIDLYRIEGESDIEGLGLLETLNDEHAIVAIEWAEKLGKFLPKHRFDINFEHISENSRKITIKKFEI